MPINQLKAGALLNYVVLGLNNLVGLLYMPYMLRMMGRSEFGLYSLVASVIAYLTVMDFGFGNAIIRYTAKFRAEGKQEEQYAMFGMFLILYVAIGALVFLAGTALYLNAEHLFGETLTPYELGRAKILMIIMILNLAVTFPLGIFGAIVTAYEDFVFQKAVQIVRIVLNTAVMICLLKMGYRAVAMVVVQTVFNLATLLLNFLYCKYKIRIRIVFGKFRWGFLREVAIYSFWIFLGAIMDRIYWNTGQFVLGAVVGTAAVAVFAVAIQLETMYMSFSTAISGVFSAPALRHDRQTLLRPGGLGPIHPHGPHPVHRAGFSPFGIHPLRTPVHPPLGRSRLRRSFPHSAALLRRADRSADPERGHLDPSGPQ